ncbi:N-acetylmuramic acid 6-phosphate etherase [Chthonobacter albigriseus]|uniref:N-acetylmuramic acid 6-phosphate etherase n=1 Tax=Chthonobacter albigriseus TaxID=1683161 RepID=UPI001FCE9804|nr:N-acetylmuramic acid 6-phosphate etherase [Chthonobacter albigriseus]
MQPKLVTEETNERYRAVETWADADVLSAIADGQGRAIEAVRAAIPALSAAAGALAQAWGGGGRIVYVGAGSSGLIALLDALELPGTYGLTTDRLPVLLAGGAASLTHLDAASEDDRDGARKEIEALGLRAGDAVIAVSASGSTPYTVAAAEAARAAGATVIGIACNARAPLLDAADLPVSILAGPEIVAGSTRMNAGTAQKCALNMLSTLAAMKLNHVYDGMMVNVRAENAKLVDRAARIVARAAGVDEAAARAAITATGGDVKPAVLVARGATAAKARQLIEASGGDLRAAFASLQDQP